MQFRTDVMERILAIISDEEAIQHSRESAYTKRMAMVHAYEEIKELIKGEEKEDE